MTYLSKNVCQHQKHHCLSITRRRKTGFFEQEIIWKSLKKQNVGENSRSSVNFQIMKLCILNVWYVLKATLNFFRLSLIFQNFVIILSLTFKNCIISRIKIIVTVLKKVVLKSLNRSKTVQKIHAKMHAWRFEVELQS